MTIQEKIDHIKALSLEKGILMGKLERSLALKTLWPDITFPAKSAVIGRPYHGNKLSTRNLTFRVTNSVNEKREFPFDSIPENLRVHHLTVNKSLNRFLSDVK